MSLPFTELAPPEGVLAAAMAESVQKSSTGVSKEDIVAKLKDDGDFDKLRIKIIRKLRENEALRESLASVVKQSATLNRPGSENLKPRQLSDAIFEEVRGKAMTLISDGLWQIIRSPDEMKCEITETVRSVYNELTNPKVKDEGQSSRSNLIAVQGEDEFGVPLKASTAHVDDALHDNEPKEPPGFTLLHNCSNGSRKGQHTGVMQSVLHEEAIPMQDAPPGFSMGTNHSQPLGGIDVDPDVPPGFG